MDAISLDDWELLPDDKSSSFMEECTNGHSTTVGKDQLLFSANLVMINMDHFTPTYHPSPYDCVLDEEAEKPLAQASQVACVQDPVVEFKDIGVVQTESRRWEFMVPEILISDAEEEEMVKYPAPAKEVYEDEVMVEAPAPDLCGEHEGVTKDSEGFECVGFSVGKLRVNGFGALCSFGVAAATLCIFLLGGRQQQKRKQNQGIHLQMYADDEVIRRSHVGTVLCCMYDSNRGKGTTLTVFSSLPRGQAGPTQDCSTRAT